METTYTQQYPFLAGGGEMGERTRQYDWSTTTLGPPDQWSLSLRTTLGIVLHSAFPMFLFWGPDLLCFYNDAYRPSLGNGGKHPALGKPAAAIWPEIWDFIGPLIEQVMRTGEPVFYQDQLVPIQRNERLEDVYWTFSYSPAYGDEGQINGMLVTCTETTDAVLSRQRLEVSEARFRTIVEQAPVAIGTFRGEDLMIETANQKVLEMLHKPASIIGKPWLEAVPELVGQPAETLIKDVYRTGIPFSATEFPAYIEKNGVLEQGYYSFSYLPLTEGGVVTGVMQVAADVTEQVLARQKIEENEAKFRSLIEESPVATCLFVGTDLVMEVINRPMLDIFGKGNQLQGMTLTDAVPELASQPFPELLRQVLRTGKTYEAREAKAELIKNGAVGTYYFDFTYKPLRNAVGEVYAVLDMAVDVTVEVLARLKLEEAESGLRVAVDMAQLGTWSIDVATNGLTYSERLIEWFGHDPKEQDYSQVIPILEANDQERVARAVAWALNPQSGGIYNETYTVIHPQTGKKRILHAQGKTVFDATGKAVRLNGTAQDITIQRELQLALEQAVQQRTEELAAVNEEMAVTNEELMASNEENAAANNELWEANNLLSRSNDNLEKFAYVASHDLQEPLRKIQSFGDLLKSQYADQLGDGVAYLDRMQSAAGRMSTLIHDLLAFSRIATQRETVAAVSLDQVMSAVLTDLDLRIQEVGAIVRVEPMPTIQGDRPQLEQLFQNLLSNALKFQRTGVKPVVQITNRLVVHQDMPPSAKPTRLAPFYYQINVKDNGLGFDEKYIDRIFQVFQRLHGRSEFAGTGIGLAICEKVMANHGGAITATSQLGQGATFSVYFPA